MNKFGVYNSVPIFTCLFEKGNTKTLYKPINIENGEIELQ